MAGGAVLAGTVCAGACLKGCLATESRHPGEAKYQGCGGEVCLGLVDDLLGGGGEAVGVLELDMVCLLVLVTFWVGGMNLGLGRFVVEIVVCWLVLVLI